MCIDICRHAHIEMYADMGIEVCIDVRWDVCIKMSAYVCYRHVCRDGLPDMYSSMVAHRAEGLVEFDG